MTSPATAPAAEGRTLRLMEVCGTHTVAIFKAGLRGLLPPRVRLISGPGCPVCVTPAGYLEQALALARTPGVTVATFGDMMRVPSPSGSLLALRRAGTEILAVYSPLDAVERAAAHPETTVVFLGIGFETTAPTVAGAILTAAERGLTNFRVLCAVKTVPEALCALLSANDAALDGFILPGHVSAILGIEPYRPLVANFGVPAVVCGFEPRALETGVRRLAELADRREAALENAYAAAVRPDGNPRAREIIAEVFEPCDAAWRGIGVIPGSGLAIREKYRAFDALDRFPEIAGIDAEEAPGCRCGDMMKGLLDPPQCPLFATACTPASPVGPCMVSSEGACAAWHRYGRESA